MFRAGVTGSGVSAANNTTLWSEGGGGLHLAAQEGTTAPGAGIGVNFGTFLYRPDISNAGQTAFYTTLNGDGIDDSNDDSIWIESGGSVNLLLCDGFSAPGMGEGTTFGSVGVPTIGRSGEIMFNATLSGPGIDATNVAVFGRIRLEVCIRSCD